MASRPGRPLQFVERRFIPIPGDRARRYYNVDTGATVSRHSYETHLARIYGFRNRDDYYSFSRQFYGGLGIENVSPRHLSRIRSISREYEKQHHMTPDTYFFRFPERRDSAEAYMHGTSGRRALEGLNHFLDFAGIRTYTPGYLPGDTPGKRRRYY